MSLQTCRIEILLPNGSRALVNIEPDQRTQRIGLGQYMQDESLAWEAIQTDEKGNVVDRAQLNLSGKHVRFVYCDSTVWEPIFCATDCCFQLNRLREGELAVFTIDPSTGQRLEVQSRRVAILFPGNSTISNCGTNSETDEGYSHTRYSNGSQPISFQMTFGESDQRKDVRADGERCRCSLFVLHAREVAEREG